MPKNWPALIIALVVSIYWSRVLMMVRQSRRKAGHGANFVPPEPLGRVLRIFWIPVILLWMLLPFVAFVTRRSSRYPAILRPLLGLQPLPVWVGWIAAVIAVAALGATFVCWARMGTSWRMGIDPTDRTQLICSGPYAFVRHPIYGLSSLLMIATLLTVPSLLMLLAAIVHLSLLQWEARREEHHLIAQHGDDYIQYSRGTGRFFPRSFKPYCPTQNQPTH
jgi:protein-S-isoprenylcysteine O-methyltransferase Ste14